MAITSLSLYATDATAWLPSTVVIECVMDPRLESRLVWLQASRRGPDSPASRARAAVPLKGPRTHFLRAHACGPQVLRMQDGGRSGRSAGARFAECRATTLER